jgi:hypothetical protein
MIVKVGNVPLDALTITTFDSGCILVQERLSLPYNRKIYTLKTMQS